MTLEEQAEEREVLLSIFPDEIVDVSPECFRISISLDVDVDGAAGNEGDDKGDGGMIMPREFPF